MSDQKFQRVGVSHRLRRIEQTGELAARDGTSVGAVDARQRTGPGPGSVIAKPARGRVWTTRAAEPGQRCVEAWILAENVRANGKTEKMAMQGKC